MFNTVYLKYNQKNNSEVALSKIVVGSNLNVLKLTKQSYEINNRQTLEQ